VYCILFPQLTLALFDRRSNWVGAAAGLAVSVLLRVGGGDATIGIPAFLPYPAVEHGEFPFRSLAMAAGLLTSMVVSRASASYAPPTPLTREPA
jgi:high affinity choline transporter 7